jgi:hypothetical protein
MFSAYFFQGIIKLSFDKRVSFNGGLMKSTACGKIVCHIIINTFYNKKAPIGAVLNVWCMLVETAFLVKHAITPKVR